MSLHSLFVALFLTLALTSAFGQLLPVSTSESFEVGEEMYDDSPPVSATVPTPSSLPVARPPQPISSDELMAKIHRQQADQRMELDLQQQQRRIAQLDQHRQTVALDDDTMQARQLELQHELEVQQVQRQRMAQLQRQRQQRAADDLPPIAAAYDQARTTPIARDSESPLSDAPLTPPVIQCIRAPCGPSADSEDSSVVPSIARSPVVTTPQYREQEYEKTHADQMERQTKLEEEYVRRALPAAASQRALPSAEEEMESLTDLLVMLDAVVAAEQAQEETAAVASDCMHDDESRAAEGGGSIVEEVVVVVAGDRYGNSMLIEMHRQIFHADDSPCSHFAPTFGKDEQSQFDAQPHTAPLASPEDNTASLESSTYSYGLPLATRITIAVVLLSALAAVTATVGCACLIRHKRRQQRVLVEPPTVEQLGLDVPMLSSSPYASSSHIVQL